MSYKADNETKIVWPEHARLKEHNHKTEIIHEFLEWCKTEKVELCMGGIGPQKDMYLPFSAGLDVDKLLAKFIGVNLEELEREKRAMLDQMRAANSLEPQ